MTSPKPSRKKRADFTPNGETFRVLFAKHPIPMWVNDIKTLAFLDVNEAALKKYGYTREEFLALTIKDIRPTDAKREVLLMGSMKQKRPALDHAGEWRHCLKNRQIIDVEITTHTLDFEGHKAALVMAQDITERKRAEDIIQKRNQILLALHNVTLEIGSELQLPILLKSILQHAQSLLGADRGGGIYLYDTNENVMRLVQGSGINQGREGVTIRMDQGVVGSVFQTSQPLVIDDYTHWEGRATVLVADPSSTVMGVPLFLNNQIVGVLTLIANSQLRKFGEQDIQQAEMFAAQASIGIQNAQHYQQAQQEISERKQAEAALRESEHRLRKFYESSMVGVIYWNMLGKITDANDIFLEMVGYTRDDLTSGRIDWTNMTPPEYRRLDDASVAELQSTGVNKTPFEKEYIRKDGTRMPIILAGAMLDDERFNGVAFILDISERKKAETSLRETSERLAHMLANSPTVIYSLKVEGGKAIPVWISDNINVILGFNAEDGLQPGWWLQQIHPEDRPEAQASLEHLFDDFYQHEYRFSHKDGRLIWLHDGHRLLRDEDNKPQEIVGAWTDITARKQAEQKLFQSKENYRQLFENSGTGVVIMDENGQYLLVNKTAAAQLGNEADKIIGKSMFDFLPHEQANFYLKRNRELINTGGYQKYEDTFLLPSGERSFLIIDQSLQDENGGNYAIQSSSIDITERKQAEEKISQLNAELEQRVEARTHELRDAQEKLMRNEKLAVLGQLAGGVGHELRNPLAVINNALYYLKLVGVDSNEKVKEYLGIIQAETHTAEKIITDLLDFARVKSVDLEPVSAFKLVERVLERYPAPKAVRVTLEFPEDLPKLYVDPRQMEQVLGNLLINACQAMLTGGELTIRAKPSTVNGQPSVAIAVRDTGVGISPENMKKLFEPLFTTKAKGIGLGLAVSQKLAEANGGRIEVQSEAGLGSTFTVYLPVKQ